MNENDKEKIQHQLYLEVENEMKQIDKWKKKKTERKK